MGSGTGAAGGGWSRRRFVGALAGVGAVAALPAPAPPKRSRATRDTGPAVTERQPSARPSAVPP